MNKKRIIGSVASVGAIALGAVGSANAAIDISAVTTAGADVVIVGTAVFAVIVAASAFKWLRRAL